MLRLYSYQILVRYLVILFEELRLIFNIGDGQMD